MPLSGKLAGIYVELEARLGKMRKGLFKARDEIDRFTKQAGASLRAFGRQAFWRLSLPFIAAIGAVTKFSVEFERLMTKVKTLVGVSGDLVDKFGMQLREMASEVAIGPTELGRALFVVTSAGIRSAKALNIVRNAAQASAVGLGDTADTARTITSAMQAYRKEGLSAIRATEILVATVREGNLESEQLAGTLGRVLGVAAKLGISFAEIGTFVATFTRLGVKPAEAITALRGTLRILLKPSQDAREALEAVGMTVQDLRDTITKKGLAQALVDLIAKFEGNFDAIGAVIPNVRALAGVLGTASSQAGVYVELSNKIANSQGILKEAFEETTKHARFQIDRLGASLQTLAISIGDISLASLTKLADALAEMVTGFAKMSDSTKKWILSLMTLAIAIGPIAFGLGILLKAVKPMRDGFDLLGAAGRKLRTPLKSLVGLSRSLHTALTVIAGSVVSLSADLLKLPFTATAAGFRRITKAVTGTSAALAATGVAASGVTATGVAASMQGISKAVTDASKTAAATTGGTITKLLMAPIKALGAVLSWVGAKFLALFGLIGGGIRLIPTLGGFFTALGAKIAAVAGALAIFFLGMTEFGAEIRKQMGLAGGFVATLVAIKDAIVDSFGGRLFAAIVDVFRAFWAALNEGGRITRGLSATFDTLKVALSALLGIALSPLIVVFQLLQAVFGDFIPSVDAIFLALNRLRDSAGDIVDSWGAAATALGQTLDPVQKALEAAGNWFMQYLWPPLKVILQILGVLAAVATGVIVGTLYGALKLIPKVLAEIIPGLMLIGKSIADAFRDFDLSAVWEGTKEGFEGLKEVALQSFGSIDKVLGRIAKKLGLEKELEQLKAGFMATIEPIAELISSLSFENIRKEVSEAVDRFKKFALVEATIRKVRAAWDWVVTGLIGAWEKIKKIIRWDWMVERLTVAWDAMRMAVASTVKWLDKVFGGMIGAIRKTVRSIKWVSATFKLGFGPAIQAAISVATIALYGFEEVALGVIENILDSVVELLISLRGSDWVPDWTVQPLIDGLDSVQAKIQALRHHIDRQRGQEVIMQLLLRGDIKAAQEEARKLAAAAAAAAADEADKGGKATGKRFTKAMMEALEKGLKGFQKEIDKTIRAIKTHGMDAEELFAFETTETVEKFLKALEEAEWKIEQLPPHVRQAIKDFKTLRGVLGDLNEEAERTVTIDIGGKIADGISEIATGILRGTRENKIDIQKMWADIWVATLSEALAETWRKKIKWEQKFKVNIFDFGKKIASGLGGILKQITGAFDPTKTLREKLGQAERPEDVGLTIGTPKLDKFKSGIEGAKKEAEKLPFPVDFGFPDLSEKLKMPSKVPVDVESPDLAGRLGVPDLGDPWSRSLEKLPDQLATDLERAEIKVPVEVDAKGLREKLGLETIEAEVGEIGTTAGESIREKLDDQLDTDKRGLLDQIGDLFKSTGRFFRDTVWKRLVDGFKALGDTIWSGLKGIVGGFKDSEFLSGIQDALGEFGTFIVSIFRTTARSMKTGAEALLRATKTGLGAIGSALETAARTVSEAAGGFGRFVEGLGDRLSKVLDAAKTNLSGLVSGLRDMLGTVLQGMSRAFGALVQTAAGAAQGFQTALATLGKTLLGVLEAIRITELLTFAAAAKKAISKRKQPQAGPSKSGKPTPGGTPPTGPTTSDTLWDQVKDFLDWTGRAFEGIGKAIWGAFGILGTGFRDAVGGVLTAIQDLFGKEEISKAAGGGRMLGLPKIALDAFRKMEPEDEGGSIVQAIRDAFGFITDGIKTVGRSVISDLSGAFGFLTETVGPMLADLLGGVVSQLQGAFAGVGSMVSRIPSMLGSSLMTLIKGIGGLGKNFLSGLSGALGAIVNGIGGLLGGGGAAGALGGGGGAGGLLGLGGAGAAIAPAVAMIPVVGPFLAMAMPFLAEGGIVKKPTLAMIGEKGDEAVIPLTKLDEFFRTMELPGLGAKFLKEFGRAGVLGDILGKDQKLPGMLGEMLGSIPAFGAGALAMAPTLGVIGDKGPEAVLPLRALDSLFRGAKDGGGAMNVQIINSTGQAARAEPGRGVDGRQMLRVMVGDEVARQVGQGGKIAQQLEATYNVPRRATSRG